MRFIREDDCRGMTVRDELIEAGIALRPGAPFSGRLAADAAYRHADLQLRRVRQLRPATDRTLPCIAKAIGFELSRDRSVVVKRETVRRRASSGRRPKPNSAGARIGDFSWRIRQLNVEVWLRRRERSQESRISKLDPARVGIKRMIWYQGEGNTGRAYEYRKPCFHF